MVSHSHSCVAYLQGTMRAMSQSALLGAKETVSYMSGARFLAKQDYFLTLYPPSQKGGLCLTCLRPPTPYSRFTGKRDCVFCVFPHFTSRGKLD